MNKALHLAASILGCAGALVIYLAWDDMGYWQKIVSPALLMLSYLLLGDMTRGNSDEGV